MKILIIDDCLPVLNSLRMLLGMYHYEVDVAQNGTALLDYNRRPDILLADYNMPGVDIFKLLSQLKNNNDFKHIPIILMSGDTNIEKISTHSLINDFITKPIIIDVLLDKLGNISRKTAKNLGQALI